MPDSETSSLDCLLRHSDWLSSLARRLAVSTKADDLVQDTWLAALHNPPHRVRSPRAWLSRVARRLARLRDPLRGAGQAPTVPRDDFPPTDEVVARIEQERLLARLVVELEEPYRSRSSAAFLRRPDRRSDLPHRGRPGRNGAAWSISRRIPAPVLRTPLGRY